MQSTLKKIGNNTKNFARNLTAGAVLASTVASTDLVENLTTTVTRPTSNMIQTIENTSEALGQTLKNTSQGNLLHSIGNTVTLLPRAIGTSAEGIVKTASHATQYVSGASQIISNGLMTGGKSAQQSFSTTDASPDISHQEIYLQDPTLLGRDGTHGLLQQKEPPKTKIGRWLGNVKKSLFNIPLNIGRIGTDIITYGAQRVRGVIESLEGISKDIKSSRSGVFTKGQSFEKKASNIVTQGVRGSVKSIGKGGWNIINEGILKSGVAVVGIGSNFIGRSLGNTVVPLFSTQAGREQKDNLFDGSSRQERFQGYYTSTPRKTESSHNTIVSDEIDNDATKKIKHKDNKDIIEEKSPKDIQKNTTTEKKEFTNTGMRTFLGSLDGGVTTIDVIKQSHREKDNKSLDNNINKLTQDFIIYKDDIISSDLNAEEKENWKTIKTTMEDINNGKYTLSEKDKQPTEEKKKEKDQLIINEALRKNITYTQRLFVKNYNSKIPISEQESKQWIKDLQGYIDKSGSVIFSGTSDTPDSVISGTVTKLTLEENNNLTVQGLTDTQEAFTTTIPLSELFASHIGFHLPVKKKQ